MESYFRYLFITFYDKYLLISIFKIDNLFKYLCWNQKKFLIKKKRKSQKNSFGSIERVDSGQLGVQIPTRINSPCMNNF